MSPNHKPKKRAVSYIRVNGNADGSQTLRSLSLQRERCQALAKQHDVEIVREFCDIGTSAHAFQRPELQRLLHQIQVEPVDYVLTVGTWKLARHSRTWEAIAKHLQATETDLITSEGSFLSDSTLDSLITVLTCLQNAAITRTGVTCRKADIPTDGSTETDDDSV